MFTLHNQGGIRSLVLDARWTSMPLRAIARVPARRAPVAPAALSMATIWPPNPRAQTTNGSTGRARANALAFAPRGHRLCQPVPRVIPRVSALDVVAEPLRMAGVDADDARGSGRRLVATPERAAAPVAWRPPRLRRAAACEHRVASSRAIPSCC